MAGRARYSLIGPAQGHQFVHLSWTPWWAPHPLSFLQHSRNFTAFHSLNHAKPSKHSAKQNKENPSLKRNQRVDAMWLQLHKVQETDAPNLWCQESGGVTLGISLVHVGGKGSFCFCFGGLASWTCPNYEIPSSCSLGFVHFSVYIFWCEKKTILEKITELHIC